MNRKNDNKHRRIFEKHYGRKVKDGYHIHHIDGNPLNNEIDNLAELTAEDHYNIHKKQGDWAACILLSQAAKISSTELSELQRLHGVKCFKDKKGIHSDFFNHKDVNKVIWSSTPPGRKPVTDGINVLKFKTEHERSNFLLNNPLWRSGYPEKMKEGLKLSKRRLKSNEAKKISHERLRDGTHNFITKYVCPNCKLEGKGPMMKRWHFSNCKQHDQKYGVK